MACTLASDLRCYGAAPGFADGAVSVQDEEDQSPRTLMLEPEQRVLDACCAPGGKTCHILEAKHNCAKWLRLTSSHSV